MWHNNLGSTTKPQGMSNSEWRSLTNERREEITQQQERKRQEEAVNFQSKMEFGDLGSDELNWLRDQIMQIKGRLS